MPAQGIVPTIMPVHPLPGARRLDLAAMLMALLLPMVAMSYWLWRIRSRRSLRGILRVAALMPAARASRVDVVQALRAE
jgi:hypothetical protein